MMSEKFNGYTDNDFSRIFALGYHHMLKNDEGIIVEYDNSHCVIWRNSEDRTIKIEPISKEDCMFDEKKEGKFKSGNFVWMHDRGMEN